MGIEAIGSAMGTVASAVGRGASLGRIFGEMPSVGAASVSGPSFLAPTFEAAPIGGLLNSIGPKLEGPLTRIVNESPVALADLENTMPLQIGKLNPVKEIRFSEPLSVSSVIAEADTILAQAQKSVIFPSVIPTNVGIQFMVAFLARSAVEPAIEARSKLQPLTETKIVNQPAQVVLPATNPALKEQEVEKLVKEKVKVEKPKETLGEEEFVEKRLYLEDKEVSQVRRFEIRRAIKLAFTIVGSLVSVVTGGMVARFLPAEHEDNRSQVVKKTGLDGSYQETVEEIADIGELESEEQAVSRFDRVVAEKKPVKVGGNGNPVRNEDVARVFKYHVVKPAQAYVEVHRRVAKKRNITPTEPWGANTTPPLGWTEDGEGGRDGIKEETSLQDYPALAKVFQG
ncbi:MAG: hypothetical protein PHE48_04705 [Candidatus Daviesbacteria bacterium]|nr:hypothetical protein [Candidatus Daviesbacteria bacterium]